MSSDGRQIDPVMFSPPVEQLSGIGQREQEESKRQKKQKHSKLEQESIVQMPEEEQHPRQDEKPLDGHIDYQA